MTTECPFWKRGYCVADKECRLMHGEGGGQLQDSYLSQIKQQQQKPQAGPIAASKLYGSMTPYASPTYGYGAPPNTEQTHKYKTVQCRHFLRGNCARGSECGFRHDGEPSAENIEKPFRVVTCKRWIAGHCALEDRCTYKHDVVLPHRQPEISYGYNGHIPLYGAVYTAPLNIRPYGGPLKRSHSPEQSINSDGKFQKSTK